MCNDKILAPIDYRYPLYIKTDASGKGLGAILAQFVNGKEVIIHYASKSLSKAEQLLHPCQQELKAILWGDNKFKEYTFGENYYIVTDNKALIYLSKFKDENTKLGRWALRLSQIADKIRHISGKENKAADALSRNPVPPTAEELAEPLDDDPDVMFVPACATFEACPTLPEIEEEQEKDEQLKELRKELSTCQTGATSDSGYSLKKGILHKKVIRQCKLYRKRKRNSSNNVNDGTGVINPKPEVHQNQASGQDAAGSLSGDKKKLEFIDVPVIPASLQKKMLRLFHDCPEAGHLGVKKTQHRLVNRVFWNGMKKDIKEYIGSCDVCQRVKYDNKKPCGLMGNANFAKSIFEKVYIDFLGPFPPSVCRNQYLLVVQDEVSKWVELIPMRTATAKRVVKCLQDIFCHFGFPKLILSDNGVQFTSQLMSKFVKEKCIEHKFFSKYHPQQNQSERVNRTLVPMLCAFIEEKHSEWDKYIPEFGLALRSAVHEVTGVSPAMLNLGREIMLPFDRIIQGESGVNSNNLDLSGFNKLPNRLREVISVVRDNMLASRMSNKVFYDAKHREIEYDVGQLVLVRSHILSNKDKGIMKKLSLKWLGPFKIHSKVNDVVYNVCDTKGKILGKKHVSHIKNYVNRFRFNSGSNAQIGSNNNNNNTTTVRRSGRTSFTPGQYRRLIRN